MKIREIVKAYGHASCSILLQEQQVKYEEQLTCEECNCLKITPDEASWLECLYNYESTSPIYVDYCGCGEENELP